MDLLLRRMVLRNWTLIKVMRDKFYRATFALGVLFLSGCTKVADSADGTGTTGLISMRVTTADTRGTVVTTDNIKTLTGYGKFTTNCWVDADEYYKYNSDGTKTTYTASHYITDATVTYTSDDWAFDEDQHWINKVNMRFWSYAPYNATSNGLTIPSTSLKAKDEIAFSYSSLLNSSDQKDLLFAYTASGERDHSTEGTHGTNDQIDVKFFHALAQVNFAISPVAADGGDDSFDNTKYKILSISVTNSPSQGSCVFDGADANAATAAPFGFTWSSQSVPASFVNDCDDDYTNTSGKWTTTTYGTSPSYTLYTTNDVFFLIPNNASGRSIDVTFQRMSDNAILTKQFAISDEWKAGEYYTYKIKATEVEGDVAFSLSLVDWAYAEEDVKYHIVMAKEPGGQMDCDETTCILNETDHEVTVKDGGDISCQFALDAPIGGKIHISLSGYIGAFEIIDISNDVIDGVNPTTFKISPLISDPKIDYTAQIHIYVEFSDGKVINADDVVQRTTSGYKPYTIILPAI